MTGELTALVRALCFDTTRRYPRRCQLQRVLPAKWRVYTVTTVVAVVVVVALVVAVVVAVVVSVVVVAVVVVVVAVTIVVQ